jgi:hypothetical protein
MRRRYIPIPRVTHYEVVTGERRSSYAHDECEMASSAAYRARATGAEVSIVTYKDDGSSYSRVIP